MDKPKQLNSGIKGVLLLVGAYILTLGMAICGIFFALIFLVDTHNCSALGDALVNLWIMIAVIFLSSIVVVGVVGRKTLASNMGCLAVVVVYAIALLGSYLFIAFGLLVAFNC